MANSEDLPSNDQGRDESLPPVAPDFIEQDFPDDLDNVVPTRGYHMLPMVGLGGSAGSITALTEFFKTMPPNSGMAFVVILHLSAEHESVLASILGNATQMPVMQAVDGQEVQPDHVYVIPPGKYLATVDGHLKLIDLEKERGKRVAIDFFFRSLADTHGPHAAAIVLSGSDGDGASGIKRVKERGGLTIAQDPDQAEYPSMPLEAINTGMIDWVLQVSDMPRRLQEYRLNESRVQLPPEDGPAVAEALKASADESEALLRDILSFLRMRTGRDFSYYKRATIVRRIGRRMQVNNVVNLQEYLDFLHVHPGEAGALLQDLLISVTNFFRDRDVFTTLENYIPELFKGKSQSDTVRVWSPACATGEEAYSLAILLLEHARTLDSPPTLQVFACDLDDDAIQTARAGHYPDSIAADVNEDRLRRFFIKDANGFRVRRELREMVLFATHDLLKDAPFSRMDLISCRNLLIYLNRDAQRRALDTFHFALKPGGLLLLGASEGVDDSSHLFLASDKKCRIYVQKPTSRTALSALSGPNLQAFAVSTQAREQLIPVVHGKHFRPDSVSQFSQRLSEVPDLGSLADLHFKLIERYAPPSVLVDSDYEILHLSQNANDFLKFPVGEPTHNLVRVVHPDLRIDLRTAFFQARETNAPVESAEVAAEIHGQKYLVRFTVTPADEIASGILLVTFQKRPLADPGTLHKFQSENASETQSRQLERELEETKNRLRDIIEQSEASTEELKASNEELQAMNEELRSATEELETSREELQSINEELTTVNQEMKGKMEEIAHANSDLQNLMAATSIATVFLDRELMIMRFTPTAAGIFNIIDSDIGRPLAHLKGTLDYRELIEDAGKVLRTLVPIDREVNDGNHWYLARLQPYRTISDQIAGVVLTLMDITEQNRAAEALRRSEERMRLLIESVKDYAIFTIDVERRIDSWNPGAEGIFGYGEREILSQSADILFTPEDRKNGDPEKEVEIALKKGQAENERWHMRKDGSYFYGSGSVVPLRDTADNLRGFVKIMRDLTESKRASESLREHMNELTRFNNAAVGRETRMIELKKEINDLCRQLNRPVKYNVDWADEPQPEA